MRNHIKVKESRTLFLVNAESSGVGYWCIGITKFEDPLRENINKYIECYRKQLLGIDSAVEILHAINKNITNICLENNLLINSRNLSYPDELPLILLEDIFDFWVGIYKDKISWSKSLGLLNYRGKVSFSKSMFIKGLVGYSLELALKIEELHTFAPYSLREKINKSNPMWS